MTKRPRESGQLVLHLDLDDPFAWIRFLAAQTWDGSRRKMGQTLATLSADLIAAAQDAATQEGSEAEFKLRAQQLRLSEADLARMPGYSAFFKSLVINPLEFSETVFERIFNPAGSYRTLAEAPGTSQILKDYARAAEGHAYFSGVLLMITANIALHHPDVQPSLNRAMEVIQDWPNSIRKKVPSDRTIWKYWKQSRSISPLWAAYITAHNEYNAGNVESSAAAHDLFMDLAKFRQMVAYAKWYSAFAVSRSSDGAAGPLIPHDEVVEVVADVSPIQPHLQPLRPEMLRAAKNYLAPSRKFQDPLKDH